MGKIPTSAGAAAPGTVARGGYFRSLEALRGIGAVAVVLFHLDDQFGYPFVFDNFNLGVDLFFVLSGFIIFHTYGEKVTNGITFCRYLWLRFARVYPLHFVTLLAFAAFQAVVMMQDGGLWARINPLFERNDITSFLANLALVQALTVTGGLTFNIPSWSISTEMYTYVVFGALFWTGLVRHDRPFAVPCLIVAVAYAVLAARTPTIHVMTDWGFVRNILGFALGIMARGVYGRLPAPSIRALTWVQLLAVAGLLLVLATPNRRVPYADFAAPFLFAVLIVGCSYDRGGFSPILLSAPFQWLGRISYSLYLTHYMLVLAVTGTYMAAVGDGRAAGTAWVPWALMPLVVAIALAIAHVTYIFVELPARTFLRTLWPDPRLPARDAPR